MKTFKIEVKETLTRVVEVQANTVEDAISEVENKHKEEEIVLDCADYDGVEIKEHKENKYNSLIEIEKDYQEKIDNNEFFCADEICEAIAILFTSDPSYVMNLEFNNKNLYNFLSSLNYTKEQLEAIEQGTAIADKN